MEETSNREPAYIVEFKNYRLEFADRDEVVALRDDLNTIIIDTAPPPPYIVDAYGNRHDEIYDVLNSVWQYFSNPWDYNDFLERVHISDSWEETLEVLRCCVPSLHLQEGDYSHD